MKSNVYFAETKAKDIDGRIASLESVINASEAFDDYKSGEIIPVKITIGDSSCVFNIQPEMAKAVVTRIKQRKAKPFLFDTSVIYKGSRQNAVDHMTLAQCKGFSQSKTGAPFIVADGVFGRDGIELPTNGAFIKKVKVPSFVGLVSNMVVISHATGHIISGYGGAIKNIAMGMSCRPTKQLQHSSIKPSVIPSKCTFCGCCIKICPANAIKPVNNMANIDHDLCLGCGECLCACKFNAIKVNWGEDALVFCKRMAEVAKAVTAQFNKIFYINLVYDISKECDCISTKNDELFSPDVGIIGSYDPVSIDKATSDLINKEYNAFQKANLSESYLEMLEYAENLGMGRTNYNLIKL